MTVENYQTHEAQDDEVFEENPEDLEQAETLYRDGGQAQFLRELLEDDVPRKSKQRYQALQKLFGAQSRNIKLSFLKEADIDFLESLFHDAKLNHMMSQPSYDYDFDDQHAFNQARMLIRASIRRGQGGNKDQMNERMALTTSVNRLDKEQTLNANDTPGRLTRFKQAFTGQ